MTDANDPQSIAHWQAEQVRVNQAHVWRMERNRYQAIAQRAQALAEVALQDAGATVEQLRQTLASIAYNR